MYLPRSKIEEIRSKHPDSIPAVVTADKHFRHTWRSSNGETGTVKLLMPTSATLFNLRLYILKILKNNNKNVTDAIYISDALTGKIINTTCNTRVADIVDYYGRDGVLYLTLHGENAFG